MSIEEKLRIKRLIGDQKLLEKDPLPFIDVFPSDDMLTWYFLIKGPDDSEYKGGYFLGQIQHSKRYPAEGPDFKMFTPNGRFKLNCLICLSNSKFHPESWSPMWNIHAILNGFMSIMQDDDKTDGLNHLHESKAVRKSLAQASVKYNMENHKDLFLKFSRFIDETGQPKKEDTVYLQKQKKIKEEQARKLEKMKKRDGKN